MSSIISVEKVSKLYRLGMIGGATLKEDFSRWWAQLRGKANPLAKIGQEHEEGRPGEQFWALQDISFQIKEGEVLGIVGRNGAGKSTLLKILSQVTSPTSGQIKIKGRIASLLEVGTGFHPELSGRENIFLNGAILGMTKAEIRKKFDEIVAFSEVEKFLDTPVKRYSSGMYVRLAFAVAAHLDPEILIVDEVLAVGDVGFQKKCLGKMQDVSSREGRTVLFVSHNMEAMRSLCTRTLLLRDGQAVEIGSPGDVISRYLCDERPAQGRTRFKPKQDSAVQLVSLCVIQDGKVPPALDARKPFTIDLTYEVLSAVEDLELGIRIYNSRGVPITTANSTDGLDAPPMTIVPGTYEARVSVPALFLMPDDYTLTAAAFQFNHKILDQRDHALQFRVLELGTSVAKYGRSADIGVVLNQFPWTHKQIPRNREGRMTLTTEPAS